MGNLSNAIAAKTARMNEIRQEVVNIERHYSSPTMSGYKERLIEPLALEAQQLAAEIARIEHSHPYEQKQVYERMFEERRQERALEAKRQARFDRIQADHDAFDAQVNALNWGLVDVTEIEDRRAIAREHIAKLAERAKDTELLSSPSADAVILAVAAEHGVSVEFARKQLGQEDFETHGVDRAGRHFVIWTDNGESVVDYDPTGSDVGSAGSGGE